ncbi:HAMP domain-containing histidine kinase [Sphingobacterium sp. InxBP1]|uniref:sensor histidine kinase n=1 Tax=Sphingobacterium sp. InxBP1 TaxID=2870328 RepID=UPI0022431D18|nr:HAMP domain-containing sensor histidine kinase [Sphingobacterium sp. InxBP1]MCW8312704.1 HAMP domain-containing histidine kinase [Sphingobacterium sp. InxBP1]
MKKALLLFYFLLFYAVMQLIWWGVMFIRFDPSKKNMIIGEGVFFLIIFLWGAWHLKRLVEREQKLLQQQQNFLLAITHELKSPLASVKLYIQTILRRDLDKEQQRTFLRNSLKDIERLDDLVENVLMTTKLDSRNYSMPKEDFNFTSLVEQIVDRLQKNSCSSQVLKPYLEADIIIHADKFAISNVVTNLIENAIKYSPACATVDVKLYIENNKIIFSVADHGIGISDEEKKLIFNKFYRVGSEATRKTKGTGLGLYIVKTVLQKHDATIKVKDNTPKGSIFEVTFERNAK